MAPDLLCYSPIFLTIAGVYFSSNDLNSSSETHSSPIEISAGKGYFSAAAASFPSSGNAYGSSQMSQQVASILPDYQLQGLQ